MNYTNPESQDQKIIRLTPIKEPEKEKKIKVSTCQRLLIHPDSRFKIIWDLVVIILSVYNSLLIPYEFAYTISSNIFLEVIDRFVDSAFIIDIFINFRTIYRNSHTDELVTDWK